MIIKQWEGDVGPMPEMIGRETKLRTTKHQTHKQASRNFFYKTISDQLAGLSIGHLQRVVHHTRHLNSKSFNTVHTREDLQVFILPQVSKISEFPTRENTDYQRSTEIKVTLILTRQDIKTRYSMRGTCETSSLIQ